jgi:hypothetical protein
VGNSEGFSTTSGETAGETRSGVVFICDASAEAHRLHATLHAQGYPVVDVPLGLLVNRIRYEAPSAVVLDADAPDAESVLREVMEASGHRAQAVLLGQDNGPIVHLGGALADPRLTFTRPIDAAAVAEAITNAIGPPPATGGRARPERTAVLMAASRRPVRVDSLGPVSHSLPPIAGRADPSWPVPPLSAPAPFAVEPSLMRFGPRSRPPSSNRGPQEKSATLSAETRALLEQGRRKVKTLPELASEPPRSPGPRAGTTVAFDSPYALALDLPLDGDEETPAPAAAPEEPPPSAPSVVPGQVTPESITPPPSMVAGLTAELDELTNPGGRQLAESSAESAEMLPPGLPPETATERPPNRDDPADAPTGIEPIGPSSMDFGEPRTTIEFDRDKKEPSRSPLRSRRPGRRSTTPPRDSVRDSVRDSLREPPREGTREPGRDSVRDTSEQPRRVTSGPARQMLGGAIAEHYSGSLAQEVPAGLRRVLLRDGDLTTVVSSAEDESLVAFLVERGDLPPAALTALAALPRFGRHGGAALIAGGHLSQDALWPVLRHHAEWLLSRILTTKEPVIVDAHAPQRLFDEPAVFGGAAGSEVYLDTLARVLTVEQALESLGGGRRHVTRLSKDQLFLEAGASEERELLVQNLKGPELLRYAKSQPIRLVRLAGLLDLGAISIGGAPNADATERPGAEPENFAVKNAAVDARAFAARVEARFQLTQEGNYFQILGVDSAATNYEVDRALRTLESELSPTLLPASHTELLPRLTRTLATIREAHHILKDEVRRHRYRLALEGPPPKEHP